VRRRETTGSSEWGPLGQAHQSRVLSRPHWASSQPWESTRAKERMAARGRGSPTARLRTAAPRGRVFRPAVGGLLGSPVAGSALCSSAGPRGR
jgi:hypothetical protein